MIDVASTSRLVPLSELTSDEVGRMYRLLSRHFEGVSYEHFRADLAEKNWALLIERGNQLVGFTTIHIPVPHLAANRSVSFTPATRSFRPMRGIRPHSPEPGSVRSSLFRQLYHFDPYVWLLITSGFRTYRLLPLFWRKFYPRFDDPTPPFWRELKDHLARERFGDRYDPTSGIVRLHNQQKLTGELSGIPRGRQRDYHISFFSSQNPGHIEGDELVWCDGTDAGESRPAGRQWRRGVPQW